MSGVYHVDGPLGQIRQMADWAEQMAVPAHNVWWETAGKEEKSHG